MVGAFLIETHFVLVDGTRPTVLSVFGHLEKLPPDSGSSSLFGCFLWSDTKAQDEQQGKPSPFSV